VVVPRCQYTTLVRHETYHECWQTRTRRGFATSAGEEGRRSIGGVSKPLGLCICGLPAGLPANTHSQLSSWSLYLHGIAITPLHPPAISKASCLSCHLHAPYCKSDIQYVVFPSQPLVQCCIQFLSSFLDTTCDAFLFSLWSVISHLVGNRLVFQT